MSKSQEESALLEMLQGPWIVKDDCGDLEIVLEERDPDSIGYCHIATCMQDNPEIAALIAAAPRMLKSIDSLLSIVTDAIMHGMPVTKQVAEARNEAVALKALIREPQ